MKRYNKRLLTAGTVLVVLAVAGCAAPTSYAGTSATPPYGTDEQLAAADVCRAIYSCCTRDCTNTHLRSGKPGAPEECMAVCANKLEDCYQAIQ